MTCAHCKYWKPDYESKDPDVPPSHWGECRASLPSTGDGSYGFWPKTSRDDWCGELVRKRGKR